MPTLTHQPTSSQPCAAGSSQEIVVAWEISPEAIRACPLAGVVALNGQASRIRQARLEWHISGESADAKLLLDLSGERREISLASSRLISRDDQNAQMRHVDVPGLLTLSIRRCDERVAYARTSLLQSALALPGGVYDIPTQLPFPS